MSVRERNRSLVMLACTLVPLCFELVAGSDMVSAVEWNVILFVFLYAAFSFHATTCRRGSVAKLEVSEWCAKVSLFLAVAYCWLSFLRGMQNSMVKCLLADVEKQAQEFEELCRQGGLSRGCLRAVESLNELNKIATNCPQVKLGPFIGKIYTVAVLCFRGIAVGIVGMWNLYSWDSERFQTKGSTRGESHERSRAPSTKHMCGLLLCLFPCVIVEVAVPHIMPLSTLGVTVVQLAVFGLQYAVKSSSREEETKSVLIGVQKVVVCTAIFYTLLDFVVQCLTVIYSCAGREVEEDSVVNTCAGARTRSELESCYSVLQEVQPSFYVSEMCPQTKGETIPSVLLYVANVVKVVVMTIGNSVVFFRGTIAKG